MSRARLTPGLPSQPFPNASAQFPFLLPVIGLLSARTHGLREDLGRILGGGGGGGGDGGGGGGGKQEVGIGSLLPDDECIHDQQGGFWGYFSTRGVWLVRTLSKLPSHAMPRCLSALNPVTNELTTQST